MRHLPILKPTASALERAILCPSSLVLPQIFEGVGEDALRGTAIGGFVRDILAQEPFEEALAKVPRADWRATCARLDFDVICGDLVDVRAEVAYGITPANENARFLGINLGRKYPKLGDGEYAGTNDLEGKIASGPHAGREVVCDLKSGMPVTECASNPQLMFHALARYLLTGAKEIEARILYVREDGSVFPDVHVFTAYELELFQDSLVALTRRIEQTATTYEETGRATVASGAHCKYCPAVQACPAYTSLARTMVTDLEEIAPRIEALSIEQACAAWEKAKRIEKILDIVLKGLKAMAHQAPLPLSTGKVVRPMPWSSTSFSQNAAVELLRAKGATHEEINALFVKTPSVQIREGSEIAKKKKAA